MPKYGSALQPPFLGTNYPLHQYAVFNAEAVTLGEYSQQVGLPLGPTTGAKGIRVEIDFSANPGNFEFDVMESDSDILGPLGYDQVPTGGGMTQANVTSGPNGANTRIATDLIPVAGQFVCLYVKTIPSNASITCTARITRAA